MLHCLRNAWPVAPLLGVLQMLIPEGVALPCAWRQKAAKRLSRREDIGCSVHGNAKPSIKGRELVVERMELAVWLLRQTAEAGGVNSRTARTWLVGYRAEL
jgi:leucine-zipper of insertion element IS481